jgi:ribosomal protein S14
LRGVVLNFYGDHDKLFSKKRKASEGARGVRECADTSGAIRMRILMRQCGGICRQKLRASAKFAVKNGLAAAGGMDQPAAVNRLHRQLFSTVELC